MSEQRGYASGVNSSCVRVSNDPRTESQGVRPDITISPAKCIGLLSAGLRLCGDLIAKKTKGC